MAEDSRQDEFQVWLSRREAGMLIAAASRSVEKLMMGKLGGHFTGPELNKRVVLWQEIIRKLNCVLDDHLPEPPTEH